MKKFGLSIFAAILMSFSTPESKPPTEGLDSNRRIISGEIGIFNLTESYLKWVEIDSGDSRLPVGVVPSKRHAIMGFIPIDLNGGLQIYWEEKKGNEGKTESFVAEFSSENLFPFVEKTKGLKFEYTGEGLWECSVFSEKFFEEQDLLVKLENTKSYPVPKKEWKVD